MADSEDGPRLPLPTGQKAVVVEYGKDQHDAIDRCLRLEPQLPPLLSEVQDGDAVVAVEAAELVWTDTVMATGQYQHQPRLPYTPGSSLCGRVVWASEKARGRGIVEGARVLSGAGGARSSGRYQKWGGCATFAVVDSSTLREVPAHWTAAQAACLCYGYDTVHYCLVEVGQLQKGQTILVQGATGGVGIPAVRIAKLLGATVIAATRSPQKLEFLRSIGADHAICIADPDGQPRRFRDDVKKLTDGRGVDVVYDGVGGDAVTVESMRCCAFGAKLLIVGWAATPDVASGGGKGRGQGAPNPNRIPTNLVMMKGLHVMGCPAVISLSAQGRDKGAAIVRRRIEDITKWTVSGDLPPPVVAREFPLGEVKDAMRSRVASGGELGSTVVVMPRLPHGNSRL